MMTLLPCVLLGVLQGGPAPAPQTWSLSPPTAFTRVAEGGHRLFKHTTRRYLMPTLEVSVPHVFSFGWGLTFASLNQPQFAHLHSEQVRRALWEVLYWHAPSFRFWKWNLTHPPIWTDHDAYVVNFGVHTWVGSTIHLLYRNHGVPFWQSILLVLAWALVWEYVSEGGYERPSLNDILTNTAGALGGEALYRAKVLIREQMQPSVHRALLLAMVDPMGELETLVLDVAEQRMGLGPVVNYLR